MTSQQIYNQLLTVSTLDIGVRFDDDKISQPTYSLTFDGLVEICGNGIASSPIVWGKTIKNCLLAMWDKIVHLEPNLYLRKADYGCGSATKYATFKWRNNRWEIGTL